ncbi:MAG: hypothetical protein Q8Q49_02780 [bacterium]|nr:hypothetical protein [bacterium]
MSEQIKNSTIKEEHGDFVGPFEYRKLIHDLRNGLSPILMQAQLLSQYVETPGIEVSTIKKSADAIEQSVRAMTILLDNK